MYIIWCVQPLHVFVIFHVLDYLQTCDATSGVKSYQTVMHASSCGNRRRYWRSIYACGCGSFVYKVINLYNFVCRPQEARQNTPTMSQTRLIKHGSSSSGPLILNLVHYIRVGSRGSAVPEFLRRDKGTGIAAPEGTSRSRHFGEFYNPVYGNRLANVIST